LLTKQFNARKQPSVYPLGGPFDSPIGQNDKRFVTKDLKNHGGVFRWVETEHFQSAVIAVQNTIGRDKLGVAHSRAVLAANKPVGQVGKTGHWRKDNIAIYGNISDKKLGAFFAFIKFNGFSEFSGLTGLGFWVG
jgi:hypothetical protein